MNLVNKEYYLFNEPHTKEEYKAFIKSFDFGYQNIEKTKQEFETMKSKYPRIYAKMIQCEDAIGDNITNVKNSKYCFDSHGAEGTIEDCAYLSLATAAKDCYDLAGVGNFSQLCYEGNSCI